MPNDLFTVAFDFPTPRPHFIILPRDPRAIKPDFSEMTEEQTRKRLIEVAESTLERTKIPDGVLSLHRGLWLDDKTKFHAHICVDVERYLELFNQEIEKPTVKEEFKEKANMHPTESRKITFDEYRDRVRAYSTGRRIKYFDEDVTNVRAAITRNPPKLKLAKDLNEFGAPAVAVIYHPSHPKIGFVARRNEITLQNLVWAIESFAKKLGLTNRDSKKFGCHVCLHLGRVDIRDWGDEPEEGKDVLGFIVTSGPIFYQLCPVEKRRGWFTRFEESKFACIT